MKQKIFLLAGEHSGDLHGSNLMKALNISGSSYEFVGGGGPKMRAVGMECWFPMEEFEVMGFTQTLRALPRIRRQLQTISTKILMQCPEITILIDYPGFNIRLATLLRKKGYKGLIVQYISPTVWAWGKSRIQKMVDSLDLLLTILPFEPSYFSKTPLKTQYVGHPLVETLVKYQYKQDWAQKLGIDLHKPILAVFPGSRKNEIQLNLKKELYAAKKLQEIKPNTIVAISCSRVDYEPLIKKMIQESQIRNAFIVPEEYTYELMKACRSAIAKSGTVNLELALHQKPAVIVYEVSALNGFIARYILGITLTHFSIVNILSKEEVYPELITYRYSAEKLFEKLCEIDIDGPLRTKCIEGCAQVYELLKGRNASHEAAQAILSLR